MMENAKNLIELANRIPIRNINFYIDSCRSMIAINQQECSASYECEIQLKKMRKTVSEGGFKENPQSVIEMMIDYALMSGRVDASAGIKLLGKFIMSYLRQGEFSEKACDRNQLPFNFLSCSIVADLRLHGHGPSYSFVEKLLDDLAEREIIDPNYHAWLIKDRCAKYTAQDIAAIFLGYSLAREGSLVAVVPFPLNAVGFTALLISELKKLLPRGFDIKRFIRSGMRQGTGK